MRIDNFRWKKLTFNKFIDIVDKNVWEKRDYNDLGMIGDLIYKHRYNPFKKFYYRSTYTFGCNPTIYDIQFKLDKELTAIFTTKRRPYGGW